MRKFFAALLLLAAGLPAHATILAVCAEDISCVFQGSVTAVTDPAAYDPLVSRVAFLAVPSATTAPPPNRIQTRAFSSPSADFWVSATYSILVQSLNTQTNNAIWVEFLDGSTPRLMLTGTGVQQFVKLRKRNSAGTFSDLGGSGTICAADAPVCKLDIHVVYGVSGSVDVYNNGALALSYSGDTTTDGATTLSQAEFSSLTSSTLGATSRWSQIIVADEDTRSFRLLTCVPQGAAGGGRQSWPAAAVSNINEITINDGTFNSTASSPARSNWTLCPLPVGLSSIKNIHTCSRVARGSTGPQSWRHSLYASGASADSGIDITTGTSFQSDCHDWGGTDPNSGLPWTRGGFPSMEAGVLSRP